jgi:hypothetical protein
MRPLPAASPRAVPRLVSSDMEALAGTNRLVDG